MFKIDSKLYPIFAVVLIFGMVSGYFLARSYAYQLGVEKGKQETEERYQAKIEEIFPSMPEQDETLSISGEIEEIQSNLLIVKETIYPSNPFEDTEIKRWQVNIVDTTELIERIEKTPEEMEAMMGDALDPMDMPMPFKEVEIEFSELKVGQWIDVMAEENIKGKTEFEASKIILSFVFEEPDMPSDMPSDMPTDMPSDMPTETP